MNQKINILSVFLLAAIAMLGLGSCKNKDTKTQTETTKKQTYTCPMHPQIVSDKPGSCPICGMDLVPFDKTNAGDFLTLSVPQQMLGNIHTDTVRTGSFSSFKQLNGRLAVNPSQTDMISSRTAGRIEALYVKETGVPVRKGQPLYKIYSEQLAALQQEYLVAVAQASQFPEDKKFQQLLEASRQKLLLYDQSEAQVQQLKTSKKTSPYLTYMAPADGIVAEVLVTEGQYVAEGSAITSLEGYHNIWVEADLYPAEASLVKTGDLVNVTVSGFENEPQKMRVEFIAPALQEGSQLLTIRGNIPNLHNQLRAGMQAVVELPVANTSRAVTLPVDAVIQDGKGAHVWVETGAGKFEPRVVETGGENALWIEITSGVQPGEVVVTDGAYLLSSEFILKKGAGQIHDH